MSSVTRILNPIENGDPNAADQLLPLVYDELRRLAAPGQTLDATALVDEANIRLVEVEKAQRWNSRGRFFAAAAEAMRRILIERARRKQRLRHGGGRNRIEFEGLNADVRCQAARALLCLTGTNLGRPPADWRDLQGAPLDETRRQWQEWWF